MGRRLLAPGSATPSARLFLPAGGRGRPPSHVAGAGGTGAARQRPRRPSHPPRRGRPGPAQTKRSPVEGKGASATVRLLEFPTSRPGPAPPLTPLPMVPGDCVRVKWRGARSGAQRRHVSRPAQVRNNRSTPAGARLPLLSAPPRFLAFASPPSAPARVVPL